MASKSDELGKFSKSIDSIYKDGVKTTGTSEEQQVLISKGLLKGLAQPLVAQIGLSGETTEPLTMLDMAGGTGVIMQEIQSALPKDVLERSSFTASDSSPALVDLMKWRAENEEWLNVDAKIVDAMSPGLPDDTFTHISVSLALHLIPQPDDTVRESIRMLKPGGIFGTSTPQASKSDTMWQNDVRGAFDSFPFEAPFPEQIPSQIHGQGRWGDRDWVEEHLKELGLKDVKVNVVRGAYRVKDVDDFLMTCGGMIAWVMQSWWSEETRAAHPLDEVKELTRKYLEKTYGGEGWDMPWALVYAAGRAE